MSTIAIAVAALSACAFLASCGPKEDPEIAVSGVTLSKSSETLEVGGSTNLTATVSPSNATSKTVTWSSSNQAVATVNGGTVTAVSPGSVTITATAGGKSGTCQVTVNKKVVEVSSVSLDKTEAALETDETLTLTATVSPSDADDPSVSWESDNKDVAAVDGSGKVTAISEGTATITAKAGGKSASCTVTVTPNRESEIKSILMEIYNAMDGPNWVKRNNWGTSEPINSWDGVRYDQKSGLTLDLRGFGLKGQIPDCIGKLTDLTQLRIQDPGITGTLPESFSKLVNLQTLVISRTSMESLPDVFSGMRNLHYVDIYINEQMTGPLPESLGSSDKLEVIALNSNAFTGTVPESWARLYYYDRPSEGLKLYGNHLSGQIPGSFLEGNRDEVAFRLDDILHQNGEGFDISGIDIPGRWPDGSVEDMVTGKTFRFDEVVAKNRYTVFLNWAPWCPFSKALLPQLLDYYKKYRQDGLEIIATVTTSEGGGFWSDREWQLQDIKDKGYGIWYNFYFEPYRLTVGYYSGTPNAQIFDSGGNTLFSPYHINDPVRNRYGHSASTDLMPFLESLFGPADEVDDYSSKDYSKDGEVMTLQKASVGRGINIVFLGDAFTDRDMGSGGLYEKVMRNAMEEFFAIEPYKTFRDRFNVYAVKVVSKNGRIGEGYTTALGTVLGDETEVSGDLEKCYGYAMKVPGISDRNNLLVNVMINSKHHSGTAVMSHTTQSSVAFTSTMGNAPEYFGPILRHEAGGHGFAFLADEYFKYQEAAPQSHIAEYNSLYEQYGWYSNVDFTDDPKKVKWSAFLEDERYKDEVGIFESGALYAKGAYRPSQNSMMKENMEYFNAPSRWAIYKRIMELSGETASFDKFLEYDAVNRGKAQSSAPGTRSGVKWQPTAPPIVVP